MIFLCKLKSLRYFAILFLQSFQIHTAHLIRDNIISIEGTDRVIVNYSKYQEDS